MLFNSVEFAGFLAACLVLYAAAPGRLRNPLLLVASYVFYAAWDWRFLSLIAISTLVDFAVGLGLGRTSEPRHRAALLQLSLAVNLGLLGYFKYAGFFVDSLRALLASWGFSLSDFAADVVLPVGISFYTFQTLSYTIDVYRGRMPPTRHLLDFALFVAFFPQLVAGPIERASRLLPQLARERPLTASALASGAWLAGWGLFKKVVIADNLAPLVDDVYAPGATPVAGEVLLATYAFAFQIYCDFSGYTDIARGVARMFGIDLMLNFRLPYLATGPADFWRRWHISLSTWLRDYLYVPLGGNRGGRARTLRNLMLTMLLGGLWHGAAWTFVTWGAYHGALLVAERVWGRRDRGVSVGAVRRTLAVFGTFHAVCLGWLVFRAESLAQARALIETLVSDPHWGLALAWLPSLGLLLLPLLLGEISMQRTNRAEVPLPRGRIARSGVLAAMLLAFLLFGDVRGGRPFVYFQF